MGKNVAVCREERELPYYKYFARGLAPIPQEKLAIVDSEPLGIGAGILFAEKDRFLAEEGKYCRIGYGENADGTTFAANQTFVPGGTMEMMDWWIPWCSVGSDLRFKIWDPEDHYFTRNHNVARLTDASIPMNERLWGTTTTVLEDTSGNGHMLAADLHFMSPEQFGYDTSLVGSGKCQSLICGGSSPCVLTHKYYECDGGLMVDTYFWIGYAYNGKGEIYKTSFDKFPVSAIQMAKLLYAHSIREMTNMAAVMPEVYAEQRDNM